MATRWLRRVVTVPSVVLGSAVLLGLALPLVPLAVLLGVARRRRFAIARTVALAASYAFMELVGLAALLIAWVSAGFGLASGVLERRAYGVQRWWSAGLWSATVTVFRLDVRIDQPTELEGPLIVLVRHVSLLDVLIPAVFVLGRGVRLRWVLKRELLYEPCLDIAGHWMPNHFVDRSSVDTPGELEAIEALARTMPDDQGLLIFPEGTRFSAARRARVLTSMEQRDPDAATRARALRSVLPPRLGGTLAAMRGAPRASALVIGHVGFEGSRSWRDLISGRLVGRTIHLRARRHTIPTAEDERVAWLWNAWADLDRWVSERNSDPDPLAERPRS